MKTTKIITITGNEIVRDYISEALGLNTEGYKDKFSKCPLSVFWDIKETGHPDSEYYKRELKEVRITIEDL